MTLLLPGGSSRRFEQVLRRRNSSKSFADLRRSLGQLKAQTAILDGEIVCLDPNGQSIFNELLHRKGCPAFYAFDILYLNGVDLRQLPLLRLGSYPQKT
jgi:bifunctional non-homologous end joining protein LigD